MNTLENPPQVTQKEPKLNDRQKAFALLRQNGLSPGKAAETLGYTSQHGYNLEKKLGKYDLKKDLYVKDAAKCVRKLVKGKAFGDIEKVKDSTALTAAGMILDRHQPVVHRNENLNLNVEIDFVDLEKYRS